MPSYICPGLLLLSRMPMLCTQILMLVQVPTMLKVPYASNANHYACTSSQRRCRLLTIHMPILTLVKVANNADNFLRLCRLPTILTPILMLVKVANNADNSIHD
ncbi:hypothetical protein O181_128559 [Austropuccinia psidii MF-1]|uniref:Secreted protein n=1 Tax=Austropuccinia psidii MF-1 TaxID=1389203 RepID=A0A9Q3Q885_9BASI|nr:hypothetical protein [Austropuccinia psidii MF-1]